MVDNDTAGIQSLTKHPSAQAVTVTGSLAVPEEAAVAGTAGA